MLNKKFVLLTAALLAAFLLVSCSDDLTSIGADLLNEDLINIEKLDSQTDSTAQLSSSFKRSFPLSGASRLFLGKHGNVESSILVRYFFSLPDLITEDSVKTQRIRNGDFVINSASISLTREYLLGDENGAFDFTAHEITSKWGTQFSADSLPALSYNASEISSNKSLGDSLLTFNIDSQFAKEWFQSEADTNMPNKEGIILRPSPNTEKVVGFSALSEANSDFSLLTIAFQVEGFDADTLRFFPTIDLSAVVGADVNPGSEFIVLQSSVSYQSKVWFDISSIPSTAIINSAELTLTVDTLQSRVGDDFVNAVSVLRFTDTSAISIDSSRVVNLSRSGENFTGDISTYVQNWVKDGNNQGLLLTPASQFAGLELFILKGSGNSNFAERPRLIITYTNKK